MRLHATSPHILMLALEVGRHLVWLVKPFAEGSSQVNLIVAVKEHFMTSAFGTQSSN